MSNVGAHAKYEVFTWARTPGETVAMAQSVDSSRRRRVIVVKRRAEGCFARSLTAIEEMMRRDD